MKKIASGFEVKKMFGRLSNYRIMSIEEYKYSYVIVKPNGARHLKIYIAELERKGIDILGFYVIHDHEKVNLELHPTEWERSHVIPINKWFNDFYGNQGILILIGEKNISYEEFTKKVFEFKCRARHLTEKTYVSCVFDRSQIFKIIPTHELKVIDSNGNEVKKYEMNHSGDFMITLPNSLHSPDANVDSTISEMKILYKIGVFNSVIMSEEILEEIDDFNSMEILKKI